MGAELGYGTTVVVVVGAAVRYVDWVVDRPGSLGFARDDMSVLGMTRDEGSGCSCHANSNGISNSPQMPRNQSTTSGWSGTPFSRRSASVSTSGMPA